MPPILARPIEHIAQAPPILIEDVSVYFDGVAALQDFQFELRAAQRLAVVGPNGAGKTTLLQLIAGTLLPGKGRVRVYGQKPGGHVCIAYVPQRSQVDWSFPVSVQDVVMMGRIHKIGLFRWPRKPDWERVRQALMRVDMSQFSDRPIGALSGGQQQRVFLAQALAQEAELVLLDEPFNGLDLPSQETILNLIDELCAEGVTVVVATHDLNLAAERFDQVLLLNQRLIAYGPPGEALNENTLLAAYGGHMHTIVGGEGLMVLTDSCCGEGEEPSG